MQLDTIAIKNFHCFGPDGVSIELADPVTALIGANGSGKTAVFQALSRMFGIGSGNRTLEKTDFHLPSEADDLESETELQIEAICLTSAPMGQFRVI